MNVTVTDGASYMGVCKYTQIPSVLNCFPNFIYISNTNTSKCIFLGFIVAFSYIIRAIFVRID